MRRPLSSLPSLAILSAAALLVPACLAAPSVKVIAVGSSACPVALGATHGVDGQLVPAGTPPAASGPRQVIDLSLKNNQLQRIVGAELEVHGTSGNSRVVPARGALLTDQPISDSVRNVHLASSIPADQQRTRTITVNDLTSVAWISVIELRYADGSTWHAGPGRVCKVTPDPAMLVANR